MLGVLAERPRYCLEIVQALKVRGFSDLSEGTLYPLLLRLEKQGLFKTDKIESSMGPSRKYYALSSEGREELARFRKLWLRLKKSVDEIIDGEGAAGDG